MAISISEEIQAILEQRQREKYKAIRKNPIYDKTLFIPVRGTDIRCLEYIPQKSEGNLPVVFDIHGGGFTNGYPEEDDFICRQICDRLQVRVFSIEYRLAPQFPYPEGQLDVYETIAYFADHAEEYKILTEKMVVCGHSAGGNYALAAAMHSVRERKFSFRGMILDYPAIDIATPAKDKFYTEGCIPIELSNIFNACYCLPEQTRDLYCSPGFAGEDILRQLPPATIITCEIDSLREEAETFGSRLAASGVEVIMRRFAGEKHAFTVQYDNPVALEALEMMIKSINRYFTAYEIKQ